MGFRSDGSSFTPSGWLAILIGGHASREYIFMSSQPKIIAVETSSRDGSAAVALGAELVAEEAFSTQAERARELLPTVARLCSRAGWRPGEIEHCYLSIGPGSFTGLRVAVTFARHLALATGARVCAVPTLEAIAANAVELPSPPGRVAVVLDAKRGEVFAAMFQRGKHGYEPVLGPVLIKPAELFRESGLPLSILGEGIDFHKEAIESSGAQVLDRVLWRPRSTMVHRIGWRLAQEGRFTPPRDLVPRYIRRPEAEELWDKRHGAGEKPRQGHA